MVLLFTVLCLALARTELACRQSMVTCWLVHIDAALLDGFLWYIFVFTWLGHTVNVILRNLPSIHSMAQGISGTHGS